MSTRKSLTVRGKMHLRTPRGIWGSVGLHEPASHPGSRGMAGFIPTKTSSLTTQSRSRSGIIFMRAPTRCIRLRVKSLLFWNDARWSVSITVFVAKYGPSGITHDTTRSTTKPSTTFWAKVNSTRKSTRSNTKNCTALYPPHA